MPKQEDDGDIEEWGQQLRGRFAAKDTSAETRALRNAIAASNLAESNVAASDHMAHARLIKRLRKEGLLGDTGSSSKPQREGRDAELRSRNEGRGLHASLGEPGLSSSDPPVSARPALYWYAWTIGVVLVVALLIGAWVRFR